jgi:hypothetical protein
MTEAAFPLLGAAFVVLVVLPLCALLSKGLLLLLERKELGGPLSGLTFRYVVLTASSAMPLAWFFSAGLHQAESGKSALACLLDHDQAARCFEPGFFALMLAAGVSAAWLRAVRGSGVIRASSSAHSRQLAARIHGLLGDRPVLAALSGRVVVTDDESFTIGAFGTLRPRVFVSLSFASSLTDPMLSSALAHEREHVRAFDTLRYLLLELSLAVNPFGRFLLDRHATLWKAAREAHCDREAVLRGAAPLPLAQAILRAARPLSRCCAALGAGNAAILKLRVSMLLAFAERAPHRRKSEGRSAIPLALTLLVLALLMPHRTGTEALDVLHISAEHAFTYFWR